MSLWLALALSQAGPADIKGQATAQSPLPQSIEELQSPLYICNGSQGYSESFGGRRTFMWRPNWLVAMKNAPKTNDNIRKIISGADKALGVDRLSVVDKTRQSPSDDPNDYVSIGPYWWPDPNKSDGLPYFRRDGVTNPERKGPEFDNGRLTDLANHVRNLSLAYYLTDDEKYAEHAGKLLRAWFITAETRMNPNFNFAQAVPGRNKGRAEGIIESSHLSNIVESIGLLRPSKTALSNDEHDKIQIWYGEFAQWMATSDNGIASMNKNNNHGVFFDYYLSHFTLFAGLESIAKTLIGEFPNVRLGVQMQENGSFPYELQRTLSWHYSHYILEAATKLATIGECVNEDLWNDATLDGRSLQTAKSFVAQYWNGEINWPYPDIRLVDGDVKSSSSNSVRRVKILFAGKNMSALDSYNFGDDVDYIAYLP